MSYTPPPTFVTGAYLSSAQLNILSDDIEYLRGHQLAPVRHFYRQNNIESTGPRTDRGGWSVMHLTNTFRYRIKVVQGTFSEIRILANGQQVFQENQNRSNPYTWDGTANISSLNLTEGAIYGIEVRLTGTTGTSIAEVQYLGEDWTNTGYSNRSATTFNNNAVLTAAQLNALGTDIKFLYERALVPNPGFYSGTNLESNNGSPVSRGLWNFIHVSNLLYYNIKLTQGTVDEVSIEVNGNEVFSYGFTQNAPFGWTNTIDMSLLPWWSSSPLVVGQTYSINVKFTGSGGVSQLAIRYIGEVW